MWTASGLSKPRLLISASVVMLLAVVYLGIAYGPAAYFVAFHKPMHLMSFNAPPKYVPPTLPHFTVTAAVASKSLHPGGTETITITATSSRTVSGYIQVWVQSVGAVTPAAKCSVSCYDKEVYKNTPGPNPTRFSKGEAGTYTYSYTLPDNIRPGIYKVSDIITSSDTFTDYSVNNDFAEFTVE